MPKKKYPRDPDAPKKPTRPFLHFMMEVYKEVKGDLDCVDGFKSGPSVSKECARRWGALDVEEKEKYNEMYRQEKAKYQETIKDYKPSSEFVEKKRLAKLHNITVKKPDIKTVPQMIRSYFDYVGQTWAGVAASLPRLDPDQVQEEIWRRWTEGEPGGGVDQNMNVVGKNIVKKRIRKKADPDGPKAPRLAFNLFLNTMKEELMKALPGLPYSALMRNVAAKWKVMTEEQKQPFFQLEKEEKERFEKKVREKHDAETSSVVLQETGSELLNVVRVDNVNKDAENGRLDISQKNNEDSKEVCSVETSRPQVSTSEDESSASDGEKCKEENGMLVQSDDEKMSSSSSEDDDGDTTSDSDIEPIKDDQ